DANRRRNDASSSFEMRVLGAGTGAAGGAVTAGRSAAAVSSLPVIASVGGDGWIVVGGATLRSVGAGRAGAAGGRRHGFSARAASKRFSAAGGGVAGSGATASARFPSALLGKSVSLFTLGEDAVSLGVEEGAGVGVAADPLVDGRGGALGGAAFGAGLSAAGSVDGAGFSVSVGLVSFPGAGLSLRRAVAGGCSSAGSEGGVPRPT